MLIRDLVDTDKAAANRLATHPLQSYEWGEFRRQVSNKVIRKGVFEKDKLVQSLQVTLHRVPQFNWQIGYFPKGNLPDEAQMKVLQQIGRENNLVLIKIEPDVSKPARLASESVAGGGWNTIDSFLRQHGCRPGRRLFTQYSFLLDITKSEEDLLAKMHPKTRYNIRLAEKKGVRVAVDDSPSCFAWFIKLLFEETVVRQGFFAHTREYFKAMWPILNRAGIAHLLRAYKGDQTLAVFMVFVFNQKIYYPYGASTRESKAVMAPNLLMWELIRYGKKSGCTSFDMWGALGPKADENDP
ncbi:peptidoglycan bridge formation glycyltransferase FemA/FemB family protein, partial [Patescibacteria group bacterium]|nr:peptidoglycan bridge formation glycyltransferase FemA/FemB family protein [Patescibacteria group bacterium]